MIWELSGRDNTFGWGLINAAAALESIAKPVHLLLTVEPSGSLCKGAVFDFEGYDI